MNEIACPSCNTILAASEDVSDYDWDPKTGCKGRMVIECPECGRKVEVEAEGYIEFVSVLTEPPMSAQEAYEQYCEMKADFRREEGY